MLVYKISKYSNTHSEFPRISGLASAPSSRQITAFREGLQLACYKITVYDYALHVRMEIPASTHLSQSPTETWLKNINSRWHPLFLGLSRCFKSFQRVNVVKMKRTSLTSVSPGIAVSDKRVFFSERSTHMIRYMDIEEGRTG